MLRVYQTKAIIAMIPTAVTAMSRLIESSIIDSVAHSHIPAHPSIHPSDNPGHTIHLRAKSPRKFSFAANCCTGNSCLILLLLAGTRIPNAARSIRSVISMQKIRCIPLPLFILGIWLRSIVCACIVSVRLPVGPPFPRYSLSAGVAWCEAWRDRTTFRRSMNGH